MLFNCNAFKKNDLTLAVSTPATWRTKYLFQISHQLHCYLNWPVLEKLLAQKGRFLCRLTYYEQIRKPFCLFPHSVAMLQGTESLFTPCCQEIPSPHKTKKPPRLTRLPQHYTPSMTGLCSLAIHTPVFFSQLTWFSLLKTLSAFHTPLPSSDRYLLYFSTP